MKVKNIILAAFFAAAICVSTAFIKLPLTVAGYVHLGDAFIFLACAFLPLPYAIAVAGLGSAMADIFAGYVIYAPATLVIKCVMALLFCLFFRHKLWLAIIGGVFSSVWMAAGYFAYETVLYGVAVALANIPFNLLQGGVCAAIALVCAYSLKQFWYHAEKNSDMSNSNNKNTSTSGIFSHGKKS